LGWTITTATTQSLFEEFVIALYFSVLVQ